MTLVEVENGKRIFDIFPDCSNQFNIAYLNRSSFPKEFKLHKKRIETFFCIKGDICILYQTPNWIASTEQLPEDWFYNLDNYYEELKFKFLKQGESYKIWPYWWHNIKVNSDKAILLYMFSEKWSQNDEFRLEIK